MTDTAVEKVQEATGTDGNGSLAKKVLIPAAAGVGTLAATVAARKAPNLLKEHVLPQLEGASVGAVKDKAKEKVPGMGGGGGREKTRRLPIQRWTDISVPVQEAYDKWTQFEEFPKFMHRVLNVEQEDGDHIKWEEKIWFSKREWEGEITDRRKNDRIAWKTTKGTAHAGVVSFHKLDTNLTRVLVTIDFRPSGMIEKMASGMRFAKRAVQADLARFKAYCEFEHAKGLEYEQPGEQEDESQDDGDDAERAQSRQERAERREERRG